jgi:adenosylcobinamide kinase/adenosylcobinamide-phosphate guanylyltransferase
MARRCILILGGARSGKSRLAQEMAQRLGEKVLFVATGAPLDEEMSSRIEEHKKKRPRSWRTLEAGIGVGEKIMEQVRDAEVVIVDCVTLLVSNVLLSGEEEGKAEAEQIDYASAEGRVVAEIDGLISCIKSTRATFIIVSNEVGMGVVPVYETGRVYRDLLGRANQLLAQQADDVYLMVAGIPWRLKGKD